MASSTPAPDHAPPSLPASPLPKRTKYTEPAASLTVASILNDAQPTPTPKTASLADPMTAAPPPLPSTTTTAAAPQTLPPLHPTALPPLQIKLLAPSAKPPTRGSAHAAGYDLYASAATTIPASGRALVSTGIAVSVPAGTYGRVAPRSGLAVKHGIDVGAGVIDADYRGEVRVLLFNFGEREFEVGVGERVAQLVVERIYTPEVVVVEELEETVRGAGGFGSTGGFGGVLPSMTGGAPPPMI